MTFEPVQVGATIAAIGALGTAAFGLVDGLKTLPEGGISNAGFSQIERALKPFVGSGVRSGAEGEVKRLLDTLHGNWINGTPAADQKAIAKSLIKMRLRGDTAEDFAKATGVDVEILKAVGQKMNTGTQLLDTEMNVLGRFDLALSAILDDGYQHADQRYRNATKTAAMLISVLLAFLGGLAISNDAGAYLASGFVWKCLFAGLLAAPLAPVSKDLASALQAAVSVAQAVRK